MRKHKLAVARLLAAAVLLVTALVRVSPFLPVFGRAFLLVPAIVCLAMFEDVIPALLFALIFGAVWDTAGTGRDGVYALFCGILAVAVCLGVRYYLRRKTATALLLNAAALVLTVLVNGFTADGAGGSVLLTTLTIAVPAMLTAFALSPLYYLIFKKIYGPSTVYADARPFRLTARKR